MDKLRIYLLSLATLVLSACAIHQPDIQQGNVLEAEKIEKLKEGMDKNQVRFLMGTPLIEDVFHPDRWDYVYSYETVGEKIEQARVTVFFSDGKVVKVENQPTVVTRLDD